MTALTDDELRELRAAEAKATPGPWEPFIASRACEYVSKVTAGAKDVVYCSEDMTRGEEHANAQLIASARNMLPKLLAEVDRLRALHTVGDAAWAKTAEQFEQRAARLEALSAKLTAAEERERLARINDLRAKLTASEQKVQELEYDRKSIDLHSNDLITENADLRAKLAGAKEALERVRDEGWLTAQAIAREALAKIGEAGMTDDARSLKEIFSMQSYFETWYRERPSLTKPRKRKARKKKRAK